MVYSIMDYACGSCRKKECDDCISKTKTKMKKRKAKAYIKTEGVLHVEEK